MDGIIRRYSRLKKVVRHAAWWRRAAAGVCGTEPLSVAEIDGVEVALVRYVQRTNFADEHEH